MRNNLYLKSTSATVPPFPLEGTSGKAHVVPYVYNASTMQLEILTGGSGVGTDVNVLNFPANPATSTLQTSGNASLTALESALVTKYAVQMVTASATVSYVGKAAIGSSTASAVWRVYKLDTTSGIVITWADGNSNYDNSFSNPASLSYS